MACVSFCCCLKNGAWGVKCYIIIRKMKYLIAQKCGIKNFWIVFSIEYESKLNFLTNLKAIRLPCTEQVVIQPQKVHQLGHGHTRNNNIDIKNIIKFECFVTYINISYFKLIFLHTIFFFFFYSPRIIGSSGNRDVPAHMLS